MAKKQTNKGPAQRKAEAVKTVKKAPVKKPETKIKEIKVEKKPVERLSGDHMVNFVSNGLSRYLRKAGKVHIVTADHAQLLIDKGYGHVV